MTVSTKVRPAQGEKARKRETAPKGERADGGNAGWPVSVPDWTSGVEAWLALQQRSLEALAEIGNLAARATDCWPSRRKVFPWWSWWAGPMRENPRCCGC